MFNRRHIKPTVKGSSRTSEKGQGYCGDLGAVRWIDVTSSSISALRYRTIKKIATDFCGSRFISSMKRTSLTAKRALLNLSSLASAKCQNTSEGWFLWGGRRRGLKERSTSFIQKANWGSFQPHLERTQEWDKLTITSAETLQKRNLCKFYGGGKYMPLLKSPPSRKKA